MNYQEAEKEFSKARSKEKGKKLANNTYLVKTEHGFGVKLHDTIVVEIRPCVYILKTGGWLTQTTKERINAFSPARISQSKSIWYVGSGLYTDGMEIDLEGNPVNETSQDEVEKTEKAKRKLDRETSKFIKNFMTHIQENGMDVPDNGDCWFCALEDKQGNTMGDLFKNVSHIHEHMKEGYFVPSMLYHAMKEHGYNDQQIAMFYPRKGEKMFSESIVQQSLVMYMRKRKPELLKLYL